MRERVREIREVYKYRDVSSTLTGIHIGDCPHRPSREVSVEVLRIRKH